MNDKKNIYFVAVLLLLGMAGTMAWGLYFREYREKDTVNIHKFPMRIADWTAVELPLTEDEYAILETHNVVARKYANPDGKRIYLLLVYSQHNRKVSHPPEICYTGSGISIVENQTTRVPLEGAKIHIIVNRLLLELRGAQQYAYYWFKVGDSYTPSYWKQQVLIVTKMFRGSSHSSALIRVSSDVISDDKDGAMTNIQQFINLIHPALQEYLP